VLTGRLQQRGDSLSISVELIDARDNTHLWGEQYTRKLADVLALQEEISREISRKLGLHLTGTDESKLTKRYTQSDEAYQLYLRGRFHWNKRNPDDLRRATEYFNQAIEKDPAYALAHTGLADAYIVLQDMGAISSQEGYRRAKEAIDAALDIDDRLAEAHTSLASFKEDQEWDWAGAEKEYRRAIELNPNYTTARQWYALLLDKLGRHEEAYAQISRAVELDPLSLVMNRNLGQHFQFSRRYDAAITQLKKTIDLDPNFSSAYFQLGTAYSESGRHEEALAAVQKGVALQSNSPLFKGLLICAYARAGKMREARLVLEEIKQYSQQNYFPSDDMATSYACLGEPDQAFTWLEKAFQERSGRVSYLKVDRAYDSLRDDPRYRDFLRRLNLPAD